MIRRRKPIQRRKEKQGKALWTKMQPAKPEPPRRRIRTVSKARAPQLSRYNYHEPKWLAVFTACAVPGCVNKTDCVHHLFGRRRELLNMKEYWFPICNQHHHEVHFTHVAQAINMGLLAPTGLWNTVPPIQIVELEDWQQPFLDSGILFSRLVMQTQPNGRDLFTFIRESKQWSLAAICARHWTLNVAVTVNTGFLEDTLRLAGMKPPSSFWQNVKKQREDFLRSQEAQERIQEQPESGTHGG